MHLLEEDVRCAIVKVSGKQYFEAPTLPYKLPGIGRYTVCKGCPLYVCIGTYFVIDPQVKPGRQSLSVRQVDLNVRIVDLSDLLLAARDAEKVKRM
eukprot:scaffold8471_cov184-Amphora_coffeaeformis.AAC.22